MYREEQIWAIKQDIQNRVDGRELEYKVEERDLGRYMLYLVYGVEKDNYHYRIGLVNKFSTKFTYLEGNVIESFAYDIDDAHKTVVNYFSSVLEHINNRFILRAGRLLD